MSQFFDVVRQPWDSLVHSFRGLRDADPRGRQPLPQVGASQGAGAAVDPLAGATIFVLRYQSTTASLQQTVLALGGRDATSLEDATHVLVPTGLGLGISPATRRVLRRAKELSVPVVEATWLELMAGLKADEHWSELPLDSHVPPVMALATGLQQGASSVRGARAPKPAAAAAAVDLDEISLSLDETWSYLRRQQPEEVEAGELARAMELSLLDHAVTLRSKALGDAAPPPRHDAASAAATLGVASGASAAELRAAYRAKAMRAHPDKGGEPGAFEKLQLAYRLLLREADAAAAAERQASGGASPARAAAAAGGGSPLQRVGQAAVLGTMLLECKPTAARDVELREHRTLVEQIFERHGGDAAAFAARQAGALATLSLEVLDAGATNRNEAGAVMSNQCFYLALACGYLGATQRIDLGRSGEVSLLHETALHLKRVVEAAVLRAHPEWAGSRVGEDVQAFSDFLFFTLDSPTLVSELAVACFDSESGFVEVYRGKSYPEHRSEEEQRANLLTIRYIPGHYQALVTTGAAPRPTLHELTRGLEAHGVLYVVTDG